MWTVTITGAPQAKGSLKCVGGKKRHQLIEDDKTGARQGWRDRIALAGRRIAAAAGGPIAGPVAVDVTFYLERPKTVPHARRPLPTVPPDVDKLARMVLDGLTDGRAWGDDAQCVELTARKAYADGVDPATGEPVRIGARLTITPLT